MGDDEKAMAASRRRWRWGIGLFVCFCVLVALSPDDGQSAPDQPGLSQGVRTLGWWQMNKPPAR